MEPWPGQRSCGGGLPLKRAHAIRLIKHVPVHGIGPLLPGCALPEITHLVKRIKPKEVAMWVVASWRTRTAVPDIVEVIQSLYRGGFSVGSVALDIHIPG